MPVGAVPIRPAGATDPAVAPGTGSAEHRVVGSAEQVVVEAALRCFARWGTTKTTLEDISREAGCSRATVYRLFPGGKHALVAAVAEHEVTGLFDVVTARLAAASSLEEMLTGSVVAAATFLTGHDALAMIVRHEPEVVLPFVAFDRLDPILSTTAELLGPLVERYCDPATARRLVEWGVRLVISYAFAPSPTITLTDHDDVARLVRTYVLPGIGVA